MRYVSQIKALMIIVLALAASGCAHKKLVDAGEDFDRQGRYELAVKKYQKALALKPNDGKTQQKLAFAQHQLDDWLDNILAQADSAKQNGLDGRALLLYSKVAQLRRDPYPLAQYKQLHQQIGEQSRYKVALDYPAPLGSNLAAQLVDVQVINQTDKSQNNQFSLKLTYTQPKFSTKSLLRDKTQQYVSGTEIVTNPEYIDLQHDIGAQRESINSTISQYEHQQMLVEHTHHTLVSLRKDREIAQLRMGNAAPNSNNYYHWRNEVNRLNNALSHNDQLLSEQRHQLDELDHHIGLYRHDLTEYLDALSYLHPTIEQDVYSDYLYQVKEVTRKGQGQLTATFSNGVKKTKQVVISDSDEGHEAHPIIELDHNPVKLANDSKLTQRYYRKTRDTAEQAISHHLKDYRNDLRDSANRLGSIDQKLEASVRYGLSGESGVDGSTASRMKSQLQQEYGIEGEFDINPLLYLFNR